MTHVIKKPQSFSERQTIVTFSQRRPIAKITFTVHSVNIIEMSTYSLQGFGLEAKN